MTGRIKAGDLRQEVVLLRPEVDGSRGTRRRSWTEAATVRADKRDVSGREFFAAHAVNAEDIVTFTIRWREDVDSSWRVRWHGIEFDILEVNHLGYMRDFLRLKCRTVGGGGV